MRWFSAWGVFIQHRERELPTTHLSAEFQNDLRVLLLQYVIPVAP
jgi:hypothetical protein